MNEQELNLDKQGGYPCPQCQGVVYEIVNWAATKFTINTGFAKGVKHLEFDLQKIGNRSTLTIPGLKYEITCVNCGYVTTPEELGMLRPELLYYDRYDDVFYLPLNIDLGSVTLTGRIIIIDEEWACRYNEMSIARNTTSERSLSIYSNCDDPVLKRMAEKRVKELTENGPSRMVINEED